LPRTGNCDRTGGGLVKPPQCKGIASTLVPDGHVQRVLDLKALTLSGLWPDWVGLLPDDSPSLMLDRSTEEIDRLDLQYR